MADEAREAHEAEVAADVVEDAQLERRRRKAETLKGLERRTVDAADIELREMTDGTLRLTGHASVTEREYDIGGMYTEVIKRGAFGRTLREEPDVALLLNHEGLPLARTSAGTLRLNEDPVGLYVEADLDPEDEDTQRLVRKMRRGDLDGQMSFAFQATGQTWSDDYQRREITAVSIHRGDVSVVNFAANPAALASVRSHDAAHALAKYSRSELRDALVEWREHTLIPLEERAGRALSAQTMDVLTNVLNLVAAADEAVDEAQPILAELMGVANPDADDETSETDAAEPPDADTPPTRAVVVPDYTTRAAQRVAALRRTT